jgi:hypothetical protein
VIALQLTRDVYDRSLGFSFPAVVLGVCNCGVYF